MPYLDIPPLPRWAVWLDGKFERLMRFFSRAPDEIPQGTHVWNNKKFTAAQLNHLDHSKMVPVSGSSAVRPRFGPLDVTFHLPALGGWNEYVVLEANANNWHVGWATEGGGGVSLITLDRPVRMLIADVDVWFFAIEADTNKQVSLKKIGRDTIGSGGIYSQLPLL